MDHLPLLIQQAPGADGFVFHGGKMNDDGSWCDELAYAWNQDKMYNRLLAVSVALTRVEPGDGGFCVIRGRPQEQHAVPREVQRYETCREFVDNPALEPGDVLFFSVSHHARDAAATAEHTDARVCTGSRRRRPRTDARTSPIGPRR